MREQIISNNGVVFWNITDSKISSNVLGTIYSTYHPNIPYEAFYTLNGICSHRVNTLEEGEKFIIDNARQKKRI